MSGGLPNRAYYTYLRSMKLFALVEGPSGIGPFKTMRDKKQAVHLGGDGATRDAGHGAPRSSHRIRRIRRIAGLAGPAVVRSSSHLDAASSGSATGTSKRPRVDSMRCRYDSAKDALLTPVDAALLAPRFAMNGSVNEWRDQRRGDKARHGVGRGKAAAGRIAAHSSA